MEEQTAGTKILLGDQRKGIIALAIPIGVAMFFQQLNNLVDSFWVAGLGSNDLAAISLIYPIYTVLIGIGTGLGVGASAAIARNIGMDNHRDANSAAAQSVVLSLLISVFVTPVLVLTAIPCLDLMGAGDTMDECLAYAYPLYFGSFFVIMSGVVSGMLRGEGAAKKSMVIQVVGALLNIILDPILIFTFDMGVAGAAIATIISFGVSLVIATYWYLKGKGMYIHMLRRDFRPEVRIWREILSVGGPEAMELTVMYIFNIFVNLIVVTCGGTDGVAAYGTGWRVIGMVMIVCQSMAGAMVAVCSAEFGMRRFDMIRDAFHYTVVVSMISTAALSVLLIVGADPISFAFSYSDGMESIHDDLSSLLRYLAVCLPMFSLVYVGSALQQALNKATGAMINSLLRNFLYVGSCWAALVLFNTFDSIWTAIVLTELIGGTAMYIQARAVLKHSETKFKSVNEV